MKLARWVDGRKLTMPAVMFLESVTPLNFVSNQVMVFFHPFVTTFLNPADYEAFQDLLEHRESIPYLIDKIENYSAESPVLSPPETGTHSEYEECAQ